MLSFITNFFRTKVVQDRELFRTDFWNKSNPVTDTLKRYRYLRNKFEKWESMTSDEQAAQGDRMNEHNRAMSINDGWNITDGLTVFTIPNCQFDCGSAPCGCRGDWREYEQLKETPVLRKRESDGR